MKHFAGINFRGEPLSKDFTEIKKGENLNSCEHSFFLYCVKVGHLAFVKIAKKDCKKNLFYTILCFLSSYCFCFLMPQ